MSGLAKMCIALGAKVSGSDEGNALDINNLIDCGVRVNRKHRAINILDDIDIVVYTSAISKDNPELQASLALNIRTFERAEFLGLIARNYANVISVAGTHGKTTTTAMIADIFMSAGLHPTVHIGGISINLGTNTVIGAREYFIVEACEYKNSFRYLRSTTGIITNIELDHLDYYKNYKHLHGCFSHFASRCKEVIIDKNIKLKHNNKFAIGADCEAQNIVFNNLGYDFDVYINGAFYESFRLNMLGVHNVKNALCAISCSYKYNIDKLIIKQSICEFKGVERRYENIGEYQALPIIIDYAHHPTEINASVEGLKGAFANPLFVFQPHTYSRTLKLFEDFVLVLKKIENLLLFKTYPARECEIAGGKAEDLGRALNVDVLQNMDCLFLKIDNIINENKVDAIVVLGAGDLAVYIKQKLYK